MKLKICSAILLSLSVLITKQTSAQAPEKMSFQAVVRDVSNNLVTSSAVGMQISILQGSANGTAVYVETQTPTSNANGLVSIEIGGGIVVSGTFASIDWANGLYFIKTETDPTGGTNYTITGTSQLLSVPYALYAATAGTASGGGNFAHYIGEDFGGGIIFHLWKDSQGFEHGYVVDKTDLSTSQVWSNITSLIGPSAQSNWDGLSNSNAIVSQVGHTNSAAAVCVNSTNNGQNDWYLPSQNELSILWNNLSIVNRSLVINGGAEIGNFGYWSSSEDLSNMVGRTYFGSGSTFGNNKSDLFRVRAIRTF